MGATPTSGSYVEHPYAFSSKQPDTEVEHLHRSIAFVNSLASPSPAPVTEACRLNDEKQKAANYQSMAGNARIFHCHRHEKENSKHKAAREWERNIPTAAGREYKTESHNDKVKKQTWNGSLFSS
jgi:hypothetical protein